MSLLNHPMVIPDQWENFTPTDHETWKLLFERQSELLLHRAESKVIQGMEKLSICQGKIPQFSELNKILDQETGFSIVPVNGLIPEDLFFRFLAERKFPSTSFIRRREQLDYLEEPDIFHDVFGHAPLLVDPIFADFMEEFGKKGLEAIELGMLSFAATIYWFTVEFGLISTKEGLRIYGAGITSSPGESVYALESTLPVRIKFNLQRLMRTKYHVDSFQKTYFVVESYEELFHALRKLDWNKLGETYHLFPEIEQGVVISHEEIFKI